MLNSILVGLALIKPEREPQAKQKQLVTVDCVLSEKQMENVYRGLQHAVTRREGNEKEIEKEQRLKQGPFAF